MSAIITRLFDTYEHASMAVAELEQNGVAHSAISLVANNADDRHASVVPTTAGTSTTGTTMGGMSGATTGATMADPAVSDPALAGDSTAGMTSTPTAESAGTGAGTGATLGTVLGGGAGLLAGLGMLAIPGVGPVVAAGWLIATAVGAGVGAASGGLIGSLVGAGVSETDAHVYAEGVRRGGTLVTVKAEDDQASMVERILDTHSPVDASARGDAYRAEGWSKFDEDAPAYRAGAASDLGTPGSTTTTTRGTPIL